MTRLELVSLLKHDTPKVYVAEHLPNMEELRDAETRKLNDFERQSLASLRDGEDVIVQATLNRIHLFGSLRPAKNACNATPLSTANCSARSPTICNETNR